MQFLIAGTVRSGTEHVAAILTEAGLDCGHEDVFNSWGSTNERCPDWRNADAAGDASYNAAPFLGQVAGEVAVVHLVRPPLDQIRAVVASGELDASRAWTRFVHHHIGLLDVGPGPARAAHYWLRWNELIEAHAKACWPLPDLEVDHLAGLFRLVGQRYTKKAVQAAIDTIGPAAPDQPQPAPTTLEDLGPFAGEVTEAAERYGVPVETSHPSADAGDEPVDNPGD